MTTTANSIIEIARSQIGVKESPAGSNRQKYGAAYGMNGVPWCAEFVWWCGSKAGDPNVIGRSASAAYIQEATVRLGGAWMMPKTTKADRRMSYARQAMPGDVVSFDFGAMDAVRDHVGIVERIEGDYIICIEGNTSARGSQSNGGQVCEQKRSYISVCSAVRPRYKLPAISTKGLEVDGVWGYQTVYRLQKWLGVVQDAEIGPKTIKALQKAVGAKVDGLWCHETTKAMQKLVGATADGIFGKGTIKALQKYLNKTGKGDEVKKEPTKKEPTKKKTKAEKLNERAIADAYAYRTDSSKYKYPTGKPKKQYKEDLDTAFPHRSGWNPQTRAGAACDVYVPVVARATGVDKHMPHGLEDMIPYLEEHCGKNDPWRLVPSKEDKKGHYYSPGMLQGGDIVVQDYKGKGSGAHVFYVVEKGGKKYISEAQFHGKTYPHISKVLKTMRKSSFDMLRVYRARG